MIFKIPFTWGKIEDLKKKAAFTTSLIKRKKKTKLENYLKSGDSNLTREEYLGISIRCSGRTFFLVAVLATLALLLLNVPNFALYGLGAGILFGGFVFVSQQNYPRLYVARRQRDIEKNLLSALEDMLVQLNAGVPLFSIMVNLSSSDYGELSNEFKKAVKKMNAGVAQTDALDDLGKNNPSVYFRRTLWQISNGMKAGSDIAVVVKESIKSLNQEQVLQIQTYGNKLNPLIMFYMLVSIILPALAVTFLTILSSMINLNAATSKALFIGLFVCVTVVQVMFLGLIKSTRPSLL